MKALNRKLLRDLWEHRGQVAANAVVIAAGVMTLIITATSLDAITQSRDRFYRDYHFADVFTELTRAPEFVAERLRGIPGVNLLETRVAAPVRMEVADYPDPVRGLLLSIPDGRQPTLNRLHLREGRLPEPGRSDQVVVSEPFAQAHGLRSGDRVTAIIRGRLESLTISGVALSPEFVYQIGPADILPDYARFGVFWMNRTALANAYAMDGAFNSVVLSLQAGAAPESVMDALDRALAPYGNLGAFSRDDQVSNRFLSEELDQLGVSAIVLPAIFLSVAAFLLNMLLARLIQTQRQQVAVLKAFGYRNREIGVHFALFAGLIVLTGTVLGVGVGAWAAHGLAGIYMEYFRFPEMRFTLQPGVFALAVAVATGSASLGVGLAVRRATGMVPAVAMRPPAPETFRQGWVERSRLGRILDQPSRIILRNLSRHRLKTSLSMLGIGLSAALLLVGSYQFSAVDHMVDVQYRMVQKMDISLHFTDPTPARAAGEFLHMPGVQYVESFREVPVRLSNGTRNYRTSLLGMDAQPQLRGLLGTQNRAVRLPDSGLVLTDHLADYLDVRPGDQIQVEIMEGHRRSRPAPVTTIVNEPVGVGAYMERRALNRFMREGPAISGVWLLTDRSHEQALFDRLRGIPRVAGIGLMRESATSIRQYLQDTMLVMMGILLLLAGSIAFAVVYNNARIAFAERSRELATLRVLGFSRGEVSWILIGEMGVITLLAIPLGWGVGTAFAYLMNQAISSDMFRLPFIITGRTYAFAAAGVLLATMLSVLLMIRRLRRLDMIAALKTIE